MKNTGILGRIGSVGTCHITDLRGNLSKLNLDFTSTSSILEVNVCKRILQVGARLLFANLSKIFYIRV